MKKNKIKKCLVTGGAGFIGSHVVEQLLDLNYQVVVVDNESSDANEVFNWRSDTENQKLEYSPVH